MKKVNKILSAAMAAVLITGILPISPAADISGIKTVTADAADSVSEWDTDAMYKAMESWSIKSVVVLDHKPANGTVSTAKSISDDGKVMIGAANDTSATMYIWCADGGKVKAAGHCRFLFSGSNSNYLSNNIKSIDCSGLDTSGETDMGYMFAFAKSLTSVNVSGLDTSSVTDMSSMFDHCNSLTSLDLSNFLTGSVTNMSCMFQSCKSLKEINLSSFNTSNVKKMSYMFNICDSLTTLDISGFDLSSAETVEAMVYQCDNITLIDMRSATLKNGVITVDFAAKCPNLKSIICRPDTYNTLGIPSTISREPVSVVYIVGDINDDLTIDGTDATLALREYAAVGSGKPSTLNAISIKAGDVDDSGAVDGSDATLLLKYYALVGAGENPRWDDLIN